MIKITKVMFVSMIISLFVAFVSFADENIQNLSENSIDFVVDNNSAISLTKNDNFYELTIAVRLTTSKNQEGLKTICSNIPNSDDLYEILYDSFEGDEIYGINYNEFTDVGNYEIIATNNNRKSITYTIKLK